MHRATVINRLPRLIEHFKADYPAITGILNEIMVNLSNMGI